MFVLREIFFTTLFFLLSCDKWRRKASFNIERQRLYMKFMMHAWWRTMTHARYFFIIWFCRRSMKSDFSMPAFVVRAFYWHFGVDNNRAFNCWIIRAKGSKKEKQKPLRLGAMSHGKKVDYIKCNYFFFSLPDSFLFPSISTGRFSFRCGTPFTKKKELDVNETSWLLWCFDGQKWRHHEGEGKKFLKMLNGKGLQKPGKNRDRKTLNGTPEV